MSLINTGDYTSEISNLQNQISGATEKAQDEFKRKFQENEIFKTLGEAKTFISGKPVLKYAFNRGAPAVKAAVEKAGLDMSKFRSAYQQAQDGDFRAAARTAQTQEEGVDTLYKDVAPDISTDGYLDVVPNATSRIGLTAGRGIGRNAMANETGGIRTFSSARNLNQNHYSSSTPLEEDADNVYTDIAPAAGPNSGIPGYEHWGPNPDDYEEMTPDGEGGMKPVAGEDLGEHQYVDVRPTPAPQGDGGTLSQEAADTKRTAQVERDDNVYKDVKPSQETANSKGGRSQGEKEASGEEEADVGGEASGEAGAGVLDAIPGLDIIGALVGIGLTASALIKKPHEKQPVDKINASYQAGIN